MFEPLYITFNFIVSAFFFTIWLLFWLVIIISMITFIGFINVRFFPNTHVGFDKILKEEKKQIIKRTRNKSSGKVNHIEKSSNNRSSHTPSVSRRKRRNNIRKRPKQKNALPKGFELNFQPSIRFNKKRYNKNTSYRHGTPQPLSQSSSSESNNSVSETASVSISQNIFKYPDNTTNNNRLTVPLSPDHDPFKLTPRMREKRQNMINLMNNMKSSNSIELTDTPNSTQTSTQTTDLNDNDSIEQEMDLEYDAFIKQQQHGVHSNNKNINKSTSVDCREQMKLVLSISTDMQSFDNIYDYMDQLMFHKINVDQSIKTEIQKCIQASSIQLKGFEKAILTQKLMEL